MKRFLTFAATAAAVLTASTGSAIAAGGQQLCLGAGMQPVTTPDTDGQCKRGTAVTMLTAQDLSALEARLSALEADNSALKSKVGALEADNSTLQTKVSTLEDKLSKVGYDETGLNDKPTLTIDGANLQILDGSGDTYGSTNGLGNLFIGYGEHGYDDQQTGSHNLVIGVRQTFTSVGGLIAGYNNTVTGQFSSALAGAANTASGYGSSVSGGASNTASGNFSSILGGQARTVSSTLGTSP